MKTLVDVKGRWERSTQVGEDQLFGKKKTSICRFHTIAWERDSATGILRQTGTEEMERVKKYKRVSQIMLCYLLTGCRTRHQFRRVPKAAAPDVAAHLRLECKGITT